MNELRGYQEAAVNKIFDYFAQGKNAGLVILPTGAGKSHVISAFTDRSKSNCLILQPSKEILEQNLQKLELYNIECSVFSASLSRKEIGKITLATIGSIVKHLDKLTDFKYLIIDECDLVNPKGGMYEELINFLLGETKIKFFGLTATPYRSHQTFEGTVLRFLTRTRPKIFQEIIYNCNPSMLFKKGYLSKCEYINYPSQFNPQYIKKNSNGSEYDSEALAEYEKSIGFEVQIEKCVKKYLETAHSILLFVSSISMGEMICEKLDSPNVAFLSSYTPPKERVETIKGFKNGEIKCVINVGVLLVGFDHPRLDCVIQARATLSLRVYYQLVGRGVRIHPEKEKCRIVDMVGNYRKFGKLEDLTLAIEREGTKLYAIYSKTFNKQLTNVTI